MRSARALLDELLQRRRARLLDPAPGNRDRLVRVPLANETELRRDGLEQRLVVLAARPLGVLDALSRERLGLTPLSGVEERLGHVAEDEAPEAFGGSGAFAEGEGLPLRRDRPGDVSHVEQDRAEVHAGAPVLERIVDANQCDRVVEVLERALVVAAVRPGGSPGDQGGRAGAGRAYCFGVAIASSAMLIASC